MNPNKCNIFRQPTARPSTKERRLAYGNTNFANDAHGLHAGYRRLQPTHPTGFGNDLFIREFRTFNSATTWGGTGSPVAGDIARIRVGNTVTVSAADGAATAATIQLGYDATTTGLNIDSGTLSLSASSYLSVGYGAGSTATVRQTGGALNLGTSQLLIGDSNTSSTASTGKYIFSGGTITQSSTAKTTIGVFSTSNTGGNGSFSVIGKATGSSITFGNLSFNAGTAGPASASSATLGFALDANGVTPISVTRLTWGSANKPTLDLSLSVAPTLDANNNITGSLANIALILVSTTAGGSASSFAMYREAPFRRFSGGKPTSGTLPMPVTLATSRRSTVA